MFQNIAPTASVYFTCVYMFRLRLQKNIHGKYAYFTLMKPNLGEVAVDMLTIAVVSLLSPIPK